MRRFGHVVLKLELLILYSVVGKTLFGHHWFCVVTKLCSFPDSSLIYPKERSGTTSPNLQGAELSALPCHGHGSSTAVRPLWMRRVDGISSHYWNTQMFDLSLGIQLHACNWVTENSILEIFMLYALPLSCISPCVQKSLLLDIVYLSTWGGMTWPFPTSAWDLLLFLMISSR